MSLSVSQKDIVRRSAPAEGQGRAADQNTFSSFPVAAAQAELSSSKIPAAAKPRSLAIERWLCGCLLKAFGEPPVRLVLWDGEEIGTSNVPPVARVIIRDRPTLWRLILDPEFQFGEAYSQEKLEVSGDLGGCLEAIYRCRFQSGTAPSLVRKTCNRLWHAGRSNSIGAARENIHQHYDMGNDFYRLWLDEEMIYSCAYFDRENMTLEEAQRAKLDYVCRKLWLRPGESVVDVGGGWGGLAIHMAKHYGVNVTAYNISREQNHLARRRARAEGLEDRVQFIEDDYRNITGQFDALVSLGMLEHVGQGRYGQFGRMADRCLAPHGRALIQSIGQSRPGQTNPWIERHIFPGGYIPTLREMQEIVEPFGFSVLDVENLRLHYARTLTDWLKRFEASAESVRKMFDERFVRMWRFYLSGSWAAFTSGAIELFQFLFARPNLNAIPWTRKHLFIGDRR